jgi:hypothetical protein
LGEAIAAGITRLLSLLRNRRSPPRSTITPDITITNQANISTGDRRTTALPLA